MMISRLRSSKQLYVIISKEAHIEQNGGLYCDASHIAVGSHLVQLDSDGGEIPISFASSKLSGVELTWAAAEKEAYAVGTEKVLHLDF